MNFFRQTINKIRHFPEYHNTVNAVEASRNSEQQIFIGQGEAIEGLKNYAERQHESLPEALQEIAKACSLQLGTENNALTSLKSFQTDFQPLLDQETEISKWREVCHQMENEAVKSEAAAQKSHDALEKAKISKPANVPKLESDYNVKKRKAEDDRKNSDTQKQKLQEEEAPYKVKFLESYVTPVSAMIDIRLKAAEGLKEDASQILAAVEKLKFFETNPKGVQKLVDELEEYNKVVIE